MRYRNMPCIMRCPPRRRPTPAQVAAVLQERFARDRRVDWKTEYWNRRKGLQAVEDRAKVGLGWGDGGPVLRRPTGGGGDRGVLRANGQASQAPQAW
jgi:hypothetical protein